MGGWYVLWFWLQRHAPEPRADFFAPSSYNWYAIFVGDDDRVRRKLDGVSGISHGANANQIFMKLRHDVPCFGKVRREMRRAPHECGVRW